MHPALSVLIFTTTSGAGYGLLALAGLLHAAGALPPDRWLGFVLLTFALILITVGLLASTFHLGHPERAWRAFSQWRSSWLSREGVMAVVTYVPAGLLWLGWVAFEGEGGFWAVCGLLTALGAAATVYCTGMIYASLPTVPQWHNPWTVPGYLLLGLMTGALLCFAIALWFGVYLPGLGVLCLVTILAAWLIKWTYWQMIDGHPGDSSTVTATGLTAFSSVRLLDPPHTEQNFLMKEMGFQIGRKHAVKLRRLALAAGGALPFLLLVLAFLAAAVAAFRLAAVLATLAAACALLGVFVERWLLFAEARHKVTLYYGADAA